ncbi:Murein DD-endopeptidase MepM and murein hydrolase activator NlpD, contain LysM domain [Geodermatophilus amargosae]|uniref:Murein DD-endopeptidase MepM and murein hydrolase activator NlpD, contain LysM domain n=1 Tax=Geodermatophilus amargosae TaxID=1296565 RepID=A0A1I7AYX3_9ACTN|nr:M23 family metallopeptidase [Geodermatophilus amargosae]SFT80104.1 Murein DD-endopeptidase MepM and murein hydrolase activator NlpD, contain LysM domain [Geodermatophilus amargosae]
MTELHPDRLLDGGTTADTAAGTPLRKAAAASPDRRPADAAEASRPTPYRRHGETSPTGESRPARRPSPRPRPTPHRRTAAAPAPAADLEVRTVVLTGNVVVTGDVVVTGGVVVTGDVVVREVCPAEPVTAAADLAELTEAADAQALAAVAAGPVELPGDTDTVDDTDADDTDDDTADDTADEAERVPVTVVAGHGRHRQIVRLLRLPHRRPAFYLAAALVGAVCVGSSIGDRVALADGPGAVSHSVSVAEELGIGDQDLPAAAEAATLRSDAALLGEVTASRNAREAEEAAAAQAQADADRVVLEAAAAAAAEAARPRTVLPVAGARLTSSFGSRWGTLHAGIDLAAPMLTPEYAAADGVVLEAGPASGYGNVVYIQHENGDVTVYGHMEEVLVQPGQVVRAGDTIALLGNRGQSTGPHLHFEVHVGGLGGEKIDPIPWLRDRGVAI